MSELTERLAEALAVCDAATEGPWEAFGSTIGAMTGPGDCGGCSGILSPAHEPACYWSEIAGAGEADAEFIARARSGYPLALRALHAVMGLRTEVIDPGEMSQIEQAEVQGWNDAVDTMQSAIRKVYGDDQSTD